jgi:hypothetical protein
MALKVRCRLALSVAWLRLTVATNAAAQGVYVSMPGSLPAQTGPNSISPSTPASSVDPNALNASAAASAVTTPNALNPSATPSTFAPILSGPGGERRVMIGPLDPLTGIVPGSGRRRMGKVRPRRSRPTIHRRADVPARVSRAHREAPPRFKRRAWDYEDSICQGC